MTDELELVVGYTIELALKYLRGLLRRESGARLDPSARPYLFLFPSAIFPLPLYSRSSLLARLYLLSTAAPSPQPTTPSLSAAPPPPPPPPPAAPLPLRPLPPQPRPTAACSTLARRRRPPSAGDALPSAGGALSSAASLSSPAQWRQPLPVSASAITSSLRRTVGRSPSRHDLGAAACLPLM
uniref:Uncharacterized protein n=1 Tax=Oryza rufipogon TaxID=4529 RepID=A0A0E0RG92_ORYRU